MNNICNISYSFLYKCINILNLLNKIFTIFKYENGKKIIFKYENILKTKKKIKLCNYIYVCIYIYILFWNSLCSCSLLGFYTSKAITQWKDYQLPCCNNKANFFFKTSHWPHIGNERKNEEFYKLLSIQHKLNGCWAKGLV